MASLIHNRPNQYRQRAEEARAKADATRDSNLRREMLQAAETWERMADYEEKHPVLGGAFGMPPDNRRNRHRSRSKAKRGAAAPRLEEKRRRP